MARGDLTLFEEFADQLGSENHVFENGGDTIKVALLTSAASMAASATTPTWSDYSANEVADSSSNYATGGATLASQSYNEASGTATFDAEDVTWSQDASSGFTNAYTALIYNDSNASKIGLAIIWNCVIEMISWIQTVKFPPRTLPPCTTPAVPPEPLSWRRIPTSMKLQWPV